jgi:hypothetical protein
MRTLRPYLEKFLPHYKGVTGQFVCNFRFCVFNYFARKGPYEELPMEEAQALSSKSHCAADESVDTDDPIIQKNVTNILRNNMTEDSGTWKALAYLEECKTQYQGFDFRVCYDKEGMPNSILWMDSRMRSNLIRFGDIICLDVQKRQYNCSRNSVLFTQSL